MTRLKTDDISDIAANLDTYDSVLLEKTGRTLMQLACDSAGVKEIEAAQRIVGCRAAVVPMTCGEGVIAGFPEAVAAICIHLGFQGAVTETVDATGVAEAVEKQNEIVLMADDHRFVAINLRTRRVSDNVVATGRGFAVGLALMSNGVEGKQVLVLGLGPVGRSAAWELISRGAQLTLFDIDQNKCRTAVLTLQKASNKVVYAASDLTEALSNHSFILDATPVPDVINSNYIFPETIVSAPGVPLGLTREAQRKISKRLLHDPLQIGVASMLLDAICHDG
ncbi:MAG: 3-methylornithyl-N6-L-lysine dehydrogenase PylD [Deltaproteobacteria bacterium]|nr:3-methylornithyl-N6-L-lysine dehydrogenase PylD [Deltaproteobacteria bacterium]